MTTKPLWPEIARLASEVIKEQRFASAQKSLDTDLFRFLHFLQEKVQEKDQAVAPIAPVDLPEP